MNLRDYKQIKKQEFNAIKINGIRMYGLNNFIDIWCIESMLQMWVDHCRLA